MNIGNTIHWIAAIIIAFFVLISVSILSPHHEYATGDAIAILTLLVTALIGWQIYHAINIEHRTKRIECQLKQQIERLANERKNIDA